MDIRVSRSNLGSFKGLRRKCKETKHFTGFLASNRFAADIIGKYGNPGELNLPDAEMVYREESENEGYEELLELISELLKLDRDRTEIHTDIFQKMLTENSILRCEGLFSEIDQSRNFSFITAPLKTVFEELKEEITVSLQEDSKTAVAGPEGNLKEPESSFTERIETIIRESPELELSVKDELIRNINEGFLSLENSKISSEAEKQIPLSENRETKRARITSRPFVIWKSEEAKNFFWKVSRLPEKERETVLKSFGGISLTHLENRLSKLDSTSFRTLLTQSLETIKAISYEEETEEVSSVRPFTGTAFAAGEAVRKEEVLSFLEKGSAETVKILSGVFHKTEKRLLENRGPETDSPVFPAGNIKPETEGNGSHPSVTWKSEEAENFFLTVSGLSETERETVLKDFDEVSLTHLENRLSELDSTSFKTFLEENHETVTSIGYEGKTVTENRSFISEKVLTKQELEEKIRTFSETEWNVFSEELFSLETVKEVSESLKEYRNTRTESVREARISLEKQLFLSSLSEVFDTVTEPGAYQNGTLTEESASESIGRETELLKERTLLGELLIHRTREEETQVADKKESAGIAGLLKTLSEEEVRSVITESADSLAEAVLNMSVSEWTEFTKELETVREKSAFSKEYFERLAVIRAGETEEAVENQIPGIRTSSEKNTFLTMLSENLFPADRDGNPQILSKDEYLEKISRIEKEASVLNENTLIGNTLQLTLSGSEKLREVRTERESSKEPEEIALLTETISRMTEEEWKTFTEELSLLSKESMVSERFLEKEKLEKKEFTEFFRKTGIREENIENILNTLNEKDEVLQQGETSFEEDRLTLVNRFAVTELSKLLFREKLLKEELKVTQRREEADIPAESAAGRLQDAVGAVRESLVKDLITEETGPVTGRNPVLKEQQNTSGPVPEITSEQLSGELEKVREEKELLKETLLTEYRTLKQTEKDKSEPPYRKRDEELTGTEEAVTVSEQKKRLLKTLEEILTDVTETAEESELVRKVELIRRENRILSEETVMKDRVFRKKEAVTVTADNAYDLLEEALSEVAETAVDMSPAEWRTFTGEVIRLREEGRLTEYVREADTEKILTEEKRTEQSAVERRLRRLTEENFLTYLKKETLLQNERFFERQTVKEIESSLLSIEDAERTSVLRNRTERMDAEELVNTLYRTDLIEAKIKTGLIKEPETVTEGEDANSVSRALKVLEEHREKRIVTDVTAETVSEETERKEHFLLERIRSESVPELPESVSLVNASSKSAGPKAKEEEIEDIRRVVRESRKAIEEQADDIEFITKNVVSQETAKETSVSITKLKEQVDLQEKQIRKLMKENDELIRTRKSDSWYTKKAVSKLNDQLRMEKLRRGL